MKLVSWNVNGLRACVQKGFLDIFREIDADIFCVQETKMQEGQLDLELDGDYQYWNYAVKKGYSCLLYTSNTGGGTDGGIPYGRGDDESGTGIVSE